MKIYEVFDGEGARSPIFQIDNVYISPATVAGLLAGVDGVTRVRQRKLFAKTSDIHVEFMYFERPYIVWEPYGDNSRYWIGPADMVVGADDVPALEKPEDIVGLENAFKRHRPSFLRQAIGDLLSLRMFTRLFQTRGETKGDRSD